MGLKICTKCGLYKSTDFDFQIGKNNADGYKTWCKECANSWTREWYQKNKTKQLENCKRNKQKYIQRNRELIWKYLETHHCIDCGESDPIVLDFDHVRGKKLQGISIMVLHGNSIKRIFDEIDKCEVRCSNCHRRKTHKQFNFYIGSDQLT